MPHEQGDVLAALSQGGHEKWNHVQTVEQVLAKIPACDFFLQVLIRGGDNADIYHDGSLAAHR